MRQVWIPTIGEPDVLELREAADPEPKPDEVRIRVHATGVNFADIMARMGLYPDSPDIPCVVGYEVAGEVDAIGDEITSHAVGDRVVSLTRFGGYSDVICVPEANAVALPESIGFEDAATIPVNWLTAWLMLVYLGNVRAGDKVLVHAAAGGVGQAAVQICRWREATIFGTASKPKHERLREMGVAHPIDYRNQDFEEEIARITGGEGVEIALDAVGGKSFTKSYNSLAALGRLYLFGASSVATGKKRSILSALKGMIQMPKFKSIPLMDENRGVHGVNLGHLWHKVGEMRGMLEEIVGRFDDGTFESTLDTTFPLEDAADAHRYIQDRKNFGKVVLTC